MDLKSKYFITFIGLCFIITFVSCLNVTDYEDVPIEQITIDYVFESDDSLGTNAKYYLSELYGTMDSGHNFVGKHSGLAGNYLAAATDDAISSVEGNTAVFKLATGAYSSANPVPLTPVTVKSREDQNLTLWAKYYFAIRKANVFINNIHVVPVKMTYKNGLSLKYAWKSEARFIRAWHYFNLLKRYGGVPLMGNEVHQLGDNLEISRSTFKECVDYVVSELNAIEDSVRTHPIPNPALNSHVVTKAAVLALKSRVLLYAASSLFNGGNIDPGNPLTGYTNYSVDRWKRASDAAREFMQETEITFSLMNDFGDIFTTVNGASLNNPEVIFFRSLDKSTVVETDNGPIGYSSAQALGMTSPTQNLVDAFPTINGLLPLVDDPAYDPNNPYANRDPRLAMTVLHNGSPWLNTQLQTFDGGRSRPGGTQTETRTSYYLRKFMGDFETANEYSNTIHDWVIFRYAEIMLNFAEAENEFAGPSPLVYQVLTDLRERAGINPGGDGMYGLEPNMTQEKMREAIYHERRIELAFEGHRYWDIRRWKIADEIFSEPLYGMRIIRKGSVFEYHREAVLTTTFEEKQYLYPIPYDEVVGNRQMVQNPGW